MGKLYQEVEQYLPTPQADHLIAEIGSDRYEGSTMFFAEIAERQGVDFHTVDLSPEVKRRVHHSRITFHTMDGLHWASTILPNLNKRVSAVYLDNFDYNWDINFYSEVIQDQKKQYRERWGIEMNNQECQKAHMMQMLAIEPYTFPGSVVVCDDTYLYNECWIGKCGPVVVYLLSRGWTLELAKDYGVILRR